MPISALRKGKKLQGKEIEGNEGWVDMSRSIVEDDDIEDEDEDESGDNSNSPDSSTEDED